MHWLSQATTTISFAALHINPTPIIVKHHSFSFTKQEKHPSQSKNYWRNINNKHNGHHSKPNEEDVILRGEELRQRCPRRPRTGVRWNGSGAASEIRVGRPFPQPPSHRRPPPPHGLGVRLLVRRSVEDRLRNWPFPASLAAAEEQQPLGSLYAAWDSCRQLLRKQGAEMGSWSATDQRSVVELACACSL